MTITDAAILTITTDDGPIPVITEAGLRTLLAEPGVLALINGEETIRALLATMETFKARAQENENELN